MVPILATRHSGRDPPDAHIPGCLATVSVPAAEADGDLDWTS